nr:n-acetylglucosamine-6-phosphate deacetylase [Quercus suber]
MAPHGDRSVMCLLLFCSECNLLMQPHLNALTDASPFTTHVETEVTLWQPGLSATINIQSLDNSFRLFPGFEDTTGESGLDQNTTYYQNMPAADVADRPKTGTTRLTGGRLVKGDKLIEEDLWISSVTGRILHAQEVFYEHHVAPDHIIDLKGRIIAPGFIDVQLNGAFGFDFSTIPNDMSDYQKGLEQLNQQLVRTGVTSFLPTLPSQMPAVYHKTLRYLAPSGEARDASKGAESLGAHCEGPFISPTKQGIHSPEVLRSAPNGFADFAACYGESSFPDNSVETRSPITMITAAPEVEGVSSCIYDITKRGIIFSLGHTEADFEQATLALQRGGSMITHVFNAMKPLHHRNPGIFGVLGKAEGNERPYFGVISDGIHLHPTTVTIAWNAHPDGFILVTDAMYTAGLPDGTYDWTNGDKWEKKGPLLTRVGTDTIAGSSAMLIECMSNFWTWSHATIPEVIQTVTSTPARMLGLQAVKGTLNAGADADLVVLNAGEGSDGKRTLEVEQIADDFSTTKRLRVHTDANKKGSILVYPYFRDTLLALIKNAPDFPPPERLKIMRAVAEALAELHAKGWIHAVDWTEADGKKVITSVALGDFDIAFQLNEGESRLTQHALGNAMWRSPEAQTGFCYILGAGDLFLLDNYQDLLEAGITPEQEVLIRHFAYFGPVPESLYTRIPDGDWRTALRGAALAADLEATERPGLRLRIWGQQLTEPTMDLLSKMKNLDPGARPTIRQVIEHPFWEDAAK